jgi:hypothetical protein
MISLLSEPELKMEGPGSALVLWVCEPFDDGYSFRDLFAGLKSTLVRKRPVTLRLPPEEPREDFVEGVMSWGANEYQVYYERSLGYVRFSSPVESDLRDLLAGLAADLSWAER